jgi:hypothetical protein
MSIVNLDDKRKAKAKAAEETKADSITKDFKAIEETNRRNKKRSEE